MCGVRAPWLVRHRNSNEGGQVFAKGHISQIREKSLKCKIKNNTQLPFLFFIPWRKQASLISGPCGSVSICNAKHKQLLFLSLFVLFSISLYFIFFTLFSLCLVLFVYWDIITCCQVPRYDSHLHILNMFLGSCWDTDCYPLMFLFYSLFIIHPSSMVLPFAFNPHWMCVKCHIWKAN